MWEIAVLPISGTFGRKAFMMGTGDERSILDGSVRGNQMHESEIRRWPRKDNKKLGREVRDEGR